MANLLKTILILLVVCVISCSRSNNNPKPLTYVYDNEHILTSNQIKSLDSLFRSHERTTTNEIVLVTTPDFGKFESNLLFAVDFGNRIIVGKKDYNNGVIISVSKSKRSIFIATGKGTEKKLQDQIVKEFIDNLMIPKFKDGLYYEGLWNGSIAIIHFLEKPENKIEKKK
jgi:uncharacterized protein